MVDDGTQDLLKKTHEKLGRVSPSFCLAKWFQVTLHLHNGQTHSCHHPNTHKIPLEELKKSPSALHNTLLKKSLRQEMLDGKRPTECGYCWNIEDAPGNHYSDRIIKSADNWAEPYFEKAATLPSTENVNPTYVEVSFSHACNFKCVYCTPTISSSWEIEQKRFGDYHTISTHHSLEEGRQQGKIPIPVDEVNPYVEAFWEWWPDLYKDLRVFRITGGEPLLSKDTFKVLDWFAEHPNKEMELAINSNLGIPDARFNEFLKKSNAILEKDSVRNFIVFTSLDTWGKAAEYIRFGLNLEKFKANVEKLLESNNKIFLTFMCTYNLLSVPGFNEFLNYIADLKERFPNPDPELWPRVTLDISHLRHPEFLMPSLMPKTMHSILEKDLEFMESAKLSTGRASFTSYELGKFRRLLAFVKNSKEAERERLGKEDLAVFFTDYDRRRNTNFLETFPMYKELMEESRSTVQKRLADQYKAANERLEVAKESLEKAERFKRDALVCVEKFGDELNQVKNRSDKLFNLLS